MSEQMPPQDESVDLFNPESQLPEEALREVPTDIYPPDEDPRIRAGQQAYRREAGMPTGVAILGGKVISSDKVLKHPAVTAAKERMDSHQGA